jgi:hypothetical protein
MEQGEAAKLRWDKLPPARRADLTPKLAGLYGQEEAAEAFAALAPDKREALLLFVNRLTDVGLWDEVEKIENLYGEGGVGMNFRARRGLAAKLERHQQFSSRFAAHGDCAAGFFEKGRAQAILHFLRMKEGAQLWSVHFDLYAPTATPFSALRHLWHEKLRRVTPDWRAIKAALD